jgi:inorganic pyrophosphatase
MNILENINNFLDSNNIKSITDLNNYISNERIKFFNTFTITSLGEPSFTHSKDSTNKIAPLLYMPGNTKEQFVNNLSIISINNLYLLAMKKLEFNYSKFHDFIDELLLLRKQLKHKNYKQYELEIIFIKYYVNSIYGMIDNTRSVLTSSADRPRELITLESQKIVFGIIETLLQHNCPVYYVNVDEIYTSLDDSTRKLLNDNQIIDIEDSNAFFIAPKKLLIGIRQIIGLKEVNEKEIIKENKHFFGNRYPDIFPEYAI